MATPAVKLNTLNPTFTSNTAQVLDLGIVSQPDGTPIDISSGYTALLNYRYSTLQSLTDDLSLTGTFSYGADGALKLTLTQAQSNTLFPGSWPLSVLVSNDSFSTSSVHGKGNLRVS